MKTKIFIAVIRHDYGSVALSSFTGAGLILQLTEYCKKNWHMTTIIHSPDVMLPETIIERYFAWTGKYDREFVDYYESDMPVEE